MGFDDTTQSGGVAMKENLIIIYLSISLLIVQILWLKAEKRASYLEGQQSIAEAIQKAVDEVEPPYTNDQPKKLIKHEGKKK